MLGDYLTALLIAVLGYVYPAYLCFKVRLASRPPSRARPDGQISSPSTPTSRRSRQSQALMVLSARLPRQPFCPSDMAPLFILSPRVFVWRVMTSAIRGAS